jgi:signal transduction histidine kinase
MGPCAPAILKDLWAIDPALEVLWSVSAPNIVAPLLQQLDRPAQLTLLARPLPRVVLGTHVLGVAEKWVLRLENEVTLQTLEGRVEDRTAALAAANQALQAEMAERARVEVELRHAQKLEAMGRLAAGIAHEVNTPLQYLIDHLGFVRDGMMVALGPEGLSSIASDEREFLVTEMPGSLQGCFDAIERVSEIVRSMRELSHPGGRRPVLMDLIRLVRNAVTISRPEWRHSAEVEVVAPEVLELYGYPGDLGQVLVNLVVNAAHALRPLADIRQRKGVIRIEVARREEGGAEVRVFDDGLGVPESIREQIFEPFFTTKPVGEGTGQGLALARAIVVDRHGGEIRLESPPSGGVTFVVVLPESPPEPAAPTLTVGA